MLAKRQETLTRHEEEYIVISDDDRFLSDAAEHGIFSKERAVLERYIRTWFSGKHGTEVKIVVPVSLWTRR